MSQENVELVHRAYEALQADDIDAFLTFVHPDVEWHSLILEIEGVFHGHDGVREWWRGLRSVFPDWQPSVVEARDYGRHVVIHARGVQKRRLSLAAFHTRMLPNLSRLSRSLLHHQR